MAKACRLPLQILDRANSQPSTWRAMKKVGKIQVPSDEIEGIVSLWSRRGEQILVRRFILQQGV